MGLLLGSAGIIWADDLTSGSCTKACKVVGYHLKVIVSFIVVPGQSPYASPACACLKPGGTILWQNEDPEVPWTVTFPLGGNPIDTPGTISDYNDTWYILDDAKEKEYRYSAKVGGTDVDPHVVVGKHPPLEDATTHKRPNDSQY
jgi:hypothetical protein